jgi:hypothetical protein
VIFKLGAAEGGYECVELVDFNAVDLNQMIAHQSPLTSNWRPIKVRRGHPTSNESKAKEADFPWYGGGAHIILRRSAVDALQPLLDEYGELLPLEDEQGVELYLFNCLKTVDALDFDKSEISYFDDGVTIIRIKRYAFLTEKLDDLAMFRLAENGLSNIYVSQRFIDAVKRAKLVGLRFREIWPTASS